jgi:hypothetical protein
VSPRAAPLIVHFSVAIQNVRYGSNAEVSAFQGQVCFAPMNGHRRIGTRRRGADGDSPPPLVCPAPGPTWFAINCKTKSWVGDGG